jgi:hypothetical protein
VEDTQDNQDGRWLSYSELAAIRGIARPSAVKLAQRERWRRSSGNDRARTVKVLMPLDWLAPAKERPVSSGDPPAQSGEDTRHLAATIASLASTFDAALAALREQLAQAEQDRGDECQRADALRERMDAMQTELAAAEAAAEALRRADAARKARGLLARLRRAWRGD